MTDLQNSGPFFGETIPRKLAVINDLTVAGTYRVSVQHPFAYKAGESVAGWPAEAVSNTMEVTVTDE